MEIETQKEVEFYGDTLTAVLADDGHIYASLSQMCGALGLQAQGQRRRIEGHDVLSEGLVQLPVDTAGGRQKVYLLRRDLVPLWLAGIQRSVDEDVRKKLKEYQLRAATVLWEAFREGRLTDVPSTVSEETRMALEIAEAVAALARSQAMLEARLGDRFNAVEARLETVEAAMSLGSRYVTQDQASQISQAVKTVALAMGKKSGRNEFQGVYGELYRRFGITGYKMLPARRFEEAMKFLTDWYEDVAGELPF